MLNLHTAFGYGQIEKVEAPENKVRAIHSGRGRNSDSWGGGGLERRVGTLGELPFGVNYRQAGNRLEIPGPRTRPTAAPREETREETREKTLEKTRDKTRDKARGLGPRFRRALRGGAIALGVLAPAVAIGQAEGVLRVGTSGDYAPFSMASPGPDGQTVFRGLAPEIARAYAEDRGLELVFVRFDWPNLLDDLGADRFDVAMGGITVRPERSLAGRFSLPITGSGAVALVRSDGPLAALADLERPGLPMAVNAGGHLERTARKSFPQAALLTLDENAGVMAELDAGRADAVITDTLEAPHWRAGRTDLRTLGPFTRDRKALWVRVENAELALDLDRWLLAQERSGRLAEWRARHLGEQPQVLPPRPVLSGLLAAMAERLALMPAVAEAKRASGSPVAVPAREVRVLKAALARVRESERALGIPEAQALPPAAVSEFFVAQIEAAKAIQRRVLAEPRPPNLGPPFSLDEDLRPALLRIGDRIARLLVQLPQGIDDDEIRERCQGALAGLGLDPGRMDALAQGLIAVEARRESLP